MAWEIQHLPMLCSFFESLWASTSPSLHKLPLAIFLRNVTMSSILRCICDDSADPSNNILFGAIPIILNLPKRFTESYNNEKDIFLWVLWAWWHVTEHEQNCDINEHWAQIYDIHDQTSFSFLDLERSRSDYCFWIWIFCEGGCVCVQRVCFVFVLERSSSIFFFWKFN